MPRPVFNQLLDYLTLSTARTVTQLRNQFKYNTDQALEGAVAKGYATKDARGVVKITAAGRNALNDLDQGIRA